MEYNLLTSVRSGGYTLLLESLESLRELSFRDPGAFKTHLLFSLPVGYRMQNMRAKN